MEQLATDLRDAGIEAILDRWDVRLGESFTDYMVSKIQEADVVIFVITSQLVAAVGGSGSGGAVRFEMQSRRPVRTAGEGVRLIGVLREGDALPGHLRDHRYADFRDDANYGQQLEQLVADLLGRKTPLQGSSSGLSSKTPTPTRATGTSERTMRMIFTKEIAHNGPSPEEIGRVGSLLFANIPAVEIPKHCIVLLRAMRAIAQIQGFAYPDARWTDWAYTDRLIEVAANALSELEYDLDRVSECAEEAVRIGRDRKLLQFEDVDEWHPGMASGSGWVEKVSLSLIGEKLLRKTVAGGGR